MKALKTFRVGDTGVTVNPGDEFETKNNQHYEKLGLATAIHAIPVPAAPKEAPAPGPTSPTGGATGATPLLSSSLQAPAPAKRRYTRRKAAPES